jgi:hypothetical protein
MKLLALFLAGLAAGVAVSWIYIASMKATLKVYATYIHDRIDAQLKDEQSGDEEAAAPPVIKPHGS